MAHDPIAAITDLPIEKGGGYACLTAAQPVGIGASLIRVEADVSRGMHAFTLVGLPDKAVGEARERIASAIRNSGFSSPKKTNKRIVLSLSPADLRKEGGQYDLALALAYLVASQEIAQPAEQALCIGELGLDGSLRPVRGVIGQLRAAASSGLRAAIVPLANAAEASLIRDMAVYGASTLAEVVAHVAGKRPLQAVSREPRRRTPPSGNIDLSTVRGQESAKRALEIAAAGRHNLMLYGPPGTGKTMLARSLTGILPPLSYEQVIEATAVHSAAGLIPPGDIVEYPPFRAPHHTVSASALIGGGSEPRPGEVTLAHAGVLFLDEMVEFDPRVIEALRQPLEERIAVVARTRARVVFPADCLLIAAINPAHTLGQDSVATIRAATRQARVLSRPIAERIDLWVEAGTVSPEDIAHSKPSESSAGVRARVCEARNRMFARQGVPNGSLTAQTVEDACGQFTEAKAVLVGAAQRLGLSPRVYHRLLKIARTIADLAESAAVAPEHVLEALRFRPRDLTHLQ